nr:wssv151 [White spot syndrome virus]AYV99419.1 WSSV104 [White spot syndrome virus]QHB92573.1 hypothetical protein [White spot syndrome virus]WOG35217.1 wssv151 [White spot syndrome virus]
MYDADVADTSNKQPHLLPPLIVKKFYSISSSKIFQKFFCVTRV